MPDVDAGVDASRQWLAGDHHVHTQYSVDWAQKDAAGNEPPTPIIGGDAVHPIADIARKAKAFGLDWMVATDHGGPHHSVLNRDRAYPELLQARAEVPEVLLFHGMEFDTPGGEHSTLIIPRTAEEGMQLFEIESRFANEDAFPHDPSRNREENMLAALRWMQQYDPKPLVIVNHPGRSMQQGRYTKYTPDELRRWNYTAPDIAVGMEGGPGHQAYTVNPRRRFLRAGARAAYSNTATRGGFDPMAAVLGGFWDSMLQDGRRWSVTANSDFHEYWQNGGDDFWPGEYSKTFVYASPDYDSVLQGLRQGRVFVATGDLISELYVITRTEHGDEAGIGEQLSIEKGDDVEVEIRFLDPDERNANDDNPAVVRVDLISGNIDAKPGKAAPTVQRFSRQEWERDGKFFVIRYVLKDVHRNMYLRVRGTNTDEFEPLPDLPGEDPWTDLWFYSSPIYISYQ